MPNHCENRLRVVGPPEALAAFVEKAQGPNIWGERVPLTYHAFVPYPEEYAEADRRVRALIESGENSLEVVKTSGFNNGGYDWCCGRWGTKWDTYDLVYTIHPHEANYDFCSAWSPPLQVIAAMAHQHPELEFEFEYYEPGMGFAGRQVYREGKRIKSEEWSLEELEET